LEDVRGCLFAFRSLADATDGRELVRFAKRWGVLGLLPEMRSLSPTEHVYSEPIEEWRACAREIRGILRLARSLTENKLGDLADWRDAYRGQPDQVPHWRKRHYPSFTGDVLLRYERERFAEVVTQWLQASRAYPQYRWNPGKPPALTLGFPDDAFFWDMERFNGFMRRERTQTMTDVWTGFRHEQPLFRPSGLLAVLSLQMAAVLTSKAGVKVCLRCDKEISPVDAKRPGRIKHCDDCKVAINRERARTGMREMRTERKATAE
jgi:hypothetical protein